MKAECLGEPLADVLLRGVSLRKQLPRPRHLDPNLFGAMRSGGSRRRIREAPHESDLWKTSEKLAEFAVSNRLEQMKILKRSHYASIERQVPRRA